MFLSSWLKEYCTVENMACTENSRRMRTQVAEAAPDVTCAVSPLLQERRLLVKDGASAIDLEILGKSGCLGIWAKAEASCCCSSGDGEQTFNTISFTWG